MKNGKLKVLSGILVVLAGCLLFSSFSPSLDGRAVVVDDGVFPQGLFAKTVGYLPGDVISVTSIGGETTVDLLVIGALDPSEGVAIMLSPEAAQAIGIAKNSNSIVKITKRSSQDERVYGSAVIAKQAIPSADSIDPANNEVPINNNILDEEIEETEYDETPSPDVIEYSYNPEDVFGSNNDEAFDETPSEENISEAEPEVSESEESEVEEDYPLVAVTEIEEEFEEEEELDEEMAEEPFIEEEFDEEYDETETDAESDYTEEDEETLAVDEIAPEEETSENEEMIETDSFDDNKSVLNEEEAVELDVFDDTEQSVEEELPVEEENAASDETAEEELPVESPIDDDGTEMINPEPFEEDLYNEDFGKPLEIDEVYEKVVAEPLEEIPAKDLFEEEVELDTFEDETDLGEEIPVEEIAADETTDESTVETIVEEESPVAESIEPDETEEKAVVTEEIIVPETTETSDTTTELEPEADENNEVISEEYEAIVLVPVEGGNPPEALVEETPAVEESTAAVSEDDDVITLDVSDSSAESKEEPETAKTSVAEVPVVIPAPVVETPKIEAASETSTLDKYKVDGLKDLKSGNYYIQIAVYKDEANIRAIVEKYGDNYPITLVPLSSGSAYQVLIGPLTVDEYATVLKRFKAYGFKDAFLRKIK